MTKPPATITDHPVLYERHLRLETFWNPAIKPGDTDARGVPLIRASTVRLWRITVTQRDPDWFVTWSDATIVHDATRGHMDYHGPDQARALLVAKAKLAEIKGRGYIVITPKAYAAAINPAD